MSETPRTDKFIHELINRLMAKGPVDMDEIRRELLHHAHLLERELQQARALLVEALEFAEDYEDVRDGPYGTQLPNKAMTLCTSIREAIERAEKHGG
jgi:hypothetical protein